MITKNETSRSVNKFFNLYRKKNREASRRIFMLISMFQIIAVKRAGRIMA